MGLSIHRSLLTMRLIPVAALLIIALAVDNLGGVSADTGNEGAGDSDASDLTAIREPMLIPYLLATLLSTGYALKRQTAKVG